METVGDVWIIFQRELVNVYEPKEIEAIAFWVLTEKLKLSRSVLKAFPERTLSAAEADGLLAILNELKTGKPVQYILGETEFYGLPFKVTPAVLIPRPETEELVGWALSEAERRKVECESEKELNSKFGMPIAELITSNEPSEIINPKSEIINILDIGSGSGCIAISLKKNFPAAHVGAIDISAEALKIARVNAGLNKVDVDFIEADILEPSTFAPNHPLFTAPYSLIISNPPYVTVGDKAKMHQNVTGFEPHTALFVPENDPLIFYRAIAAFAQQHLEDGGVLFFEINEAYGREIVKLLADKGFTEVELRQDMSCRDRMIKAVK
jgi:release factor glutamine methyltransferase